jgi:branched-chain amino acid transport system ATP-binding protein
MSTFRVEHATRSSRIGVAVFAVLLIVLAVAPWWGGRQDLRLLAEIYCFVTLASLWNLLAGYAGLVSVGQQAYVGLGAYMLFGVSLQVAAGQVVAVIGANGAGKSTLLNCIAGLVRARHDAVVLAGEPVGDLPAHAVAARGVALVPEGRRLFASLTVEENLRIGGQLGRAGPWHLARVYELFPVLADRRDAPSTSLSGGQQQMVAIGRALMSNPTLLLCDEISLGLAPIVVREIYARLPAIRGEGLSLIIVEQDVVQALAAADRVYCLQEGRVALSGAAGELTREAISAAYFGV